MAVFHIIMYRKPAKFKIKFLTKRLCKAIIYFVTIEVEVWFLI